MPEQIVTVSLNPSVDRVLEVKKFSLGAHQIGREVVRIAGGKAVNVSRILGELGVRNIATGFLGRDNRQEMAGFLEDPMVMDEFFVLPGRTRENITIMDPTVPQETHIRDVGLAVAPTALERLGRKLTLMSRQHPTIIFAGSLPPGVDPSAFRQLVADCIAGGARVAVDTSGPPMREVADLGLWLVKPNAAELAELMGRDLPTSQDQIAAARELAGHVEIVILTRGAQGAMLFTQGLAVAGHVPVRPEDIRNTVGSGDAMLGAFIAGVAQGRDLHQSFSLALACATASAMNIGPARFKPALLAELNNKVVLTDLA